MSSAAGWFTDPTGRHQLRYWDGAAWTDHVSDAGAVSADPIAHAIANPVAVTPAPAAGGGGWMDKVKLAATQAATTASAAVDSASDAISDQNAQWRAQRQAQAAATGQPGQPPAAAPMPPPASAAAPVPPTAPPGAGQGDDVVEQLKRLGELRDQGVLSDEEFAAQKAKLLGS